MSIRLACAILSLANAYESVMEQPLTIDWFDHPGQEEKLAVLLLQTSWNDAIDWAHDTLENIKSIVDIHLGMDALKR